ncbi:MAG: radical SAM protein [Candidatus Bathyarchaeia archaeon]
MRVMLANPPAYMDDPKRHFIQSGSRWSFSLFIPKHVKEHYQPYPFGLGYATSLLKQDPTNEVVGLDACAMDLDASEFIQSVSAFSPDILLVDVPTVSFPPTMKLLSEIKTRIGCKIVLAGGHVTALANDVLMEYPYIDYCMLGEYEQSFRDFVRFEQQNGKGTVLVDSIAYRREAQVITNRSNAHNSTLADLDQLPYPDRDDFKVQWYHDFEVAGKPCVQMLTSRGCPYKCSFCMPIRVMYGDTSYYSKRHPTSIVDEMVAVSEKYGARQVYFDDDTFAVDRQLNAQRTKTFAEWCKKLGIWTHATYIIGLPGETREDILRTIKFAKSLDTDSVQFSIATPFPGTPFYMQAKENGWLTTTDWTMYDGGNFSVLNYPQLSTGEIEELHKTALKKWYTSVLLRELLHPRRIRKIIAAGSLAYATRKITSHLAGRL